MSTNKFCASQDLTNEASVETFFVNKLLEDIGYENENIDLKTSIEEFAVGKGSKKLLYKPDYILKSNKIPTIVIDAKSPEVKIEDFELQCSSYCLELNKLFDYNPVKYYVLTNGFVTSVYQWDKRKPLCTLDFEDFVDGNKNFEDLIEIIGFDNIKHEAEEAKKEIDNARFDFSTISHAELNTKFQKLHNFIWKAEKKGPSAAFIELMKVVFVKIKKDRQLYENLGTPPKPLYKDVIFSSHWISSQTEEDSPINDPLFKNLVKDLEKEITKKKKKRIFEKNEQINLSSETIKKVVKEIENIDFIAMEEDIHGRMFESFLDATIRGKDIGQFFTPREIVDLMVALADIEVTKQKVGTVLDACCGSGGFLISALGAMLKKASSLSGVTNQETKALQETIKNKSIFGIDAGSDPSMYKIARMNMYLHGDGGSNIFYADSLNKGFGRVGQSSIEVDEQLEELRTQVLKEGRKFDVILSNPPFSMEYNRDDPQQATILNQYTISVDRKKGKILNKLISSVMFLERYRDLVSDNGNIFAIVDDSVLSGDSYRHVRNYIRENFIVVGIISLPGDCFRRASARVKTSVVILRLKNEIEVEPKEFQKEKQNDVFMTSSIYLGLEDKTAKRIGINTSTLAENKRKEFARIVEDFEAYKSGKSGDYVVDASRISDRLDVKYCINDCGRKKSEWIKKGYDITSIGNELVEQKGRSNKLDSDSEYQFLRVTYDGEILDGDLVDGSSSSYSKLFKVKEWDILLSNIGVGRGALGIVPPYHSGKFVSNEYTILRASTKEEAAFYCNLLRTKEILGDILSKTTGMNRGRIKWNTVSSVEVPKYKSGDKEIEALVKEMEDFWTSFHKFTSSKNAHTKAVTDKLKVDEDDSKKRWLSFKPPE